MFKPAMLKYKCFPLEVLKRLKVCENVFGLKSYLFYTSPSEKCPCFYISRLRSQWKGICSGRAAGCGCTSNGLAVWLFWEQPQNRALRQKWGVSVVSSPLLQGSRWWALQGGGAHSRVRWEPPGVTELTPGEKQVCREDSVQAWGGGTTIWRTQWREAL